MIEASLIKRELITEVTQLLIVIVIAYHLFIESKIDRKKKMLLLAFISYSINLLLHMSMRATEAGFLGMPYPEILSLFSHAFKTMFFMIFGYTLLDALIIEESLRRILRSTAVLYFLILIITSLGIIFLEGVEVLFERTAKEIVYELMEMAVQLMIINIIYQCWRDTRFKNLVLTGGAFALYLIADATHTYSLIWGFSALEYSLRHIVRLTALLLLAYTLLFHAEK